MGYIRTANTYIVINEDGKHECRLIRRRPMDDRWRADDVAAIKHTPWTERTRVPAEVRFQEAVQPRDDAPDTAPPAQLRRLRINQSDLDAHGYTGGCPQCDYIQRRGKARPGGAHSQACRTRLIEAISASDAGRERVEGNEERTNRAIAENIEHADRRDARSPCPPSTPSRAPEFSHAGTSGSQSARAEC